MANTALTKTTLGHSMISKKRFGAIMNKGAIDISQIDYSAIGALPQEDTIRLCANHVAERRTVAINQTINYNERR